MGFPEGLKICHTKRFFLEFTLGLFQNLLCDMRNILKCFNIIYFWHIFYPTILYVPEIHRYKHLNFQYIYLISYKIAKKGKSPFEKFAFMIYENTMCLKLHRALINSSNLHFCRLLKS